MASKSVSELKSLETFLSLRVSEETPDQPNLPQNVKENLSFNKIYGRILSVRPPYETHPKELSIGRTTAFMFGEDSVFSLIRDKIVPDSYGVLLSLGLTPEHIKMKLVARKERFWLLLVSIQISQAGNSASNHELLHVFPATWEGITSIIQLHYPKALHDYINYLTEIQTKPTSYFQDISGICFLKCLELRDEHNAKSPYMNYNRYLECPEPRTSWQLRLFLYCELRLLDKFVGNGRTLMADNSYGPLEYIASNVQLNTFQPSNVFLAPIHVYLPS